VQKKKFVQEKKLILEIKNAVFPKNGIKNLKLKLAMLISTRRMGRLKPSFLPSSANSSSQNRFNN